jgi:2-C-methyl-D-erythritol 4-phosphate cytidylyltransferase/2-C-methyl-D-erythritol 2,4-cyclodiphosphate synthase
MTPRVAAIIAAGGRGTRLGAAVPKQLLEVGGKPILLRSVEAFIAHPEISEVVVVLPADLAAAPPACLTQLSRQVLVVAGGPRRQDSVANGFAAVSDRADLILVHDAARPFVSADLISRTIQAGADFGAALAALPSSDTVKLARADDERECPAVDRTIPREQVFLAQTPQVFRREVLRAIVAAAAGTDVATDEAALAEAAGYPVRLVPGEPGNLKITTAGDLDAARARAAAAERIRMRVGTGYDLHRLVEGRPLILGGVVVPFDKGLAGHSDADVLAHAVTDAILGACGQGDIGRHFPDTDPTWRGADSLRMLAHAAALARDAGYTIENVDAVVIAERPKLLPHLDAIRSSLARTLAIDPGRVSVKGKTNEGVGELGRSEAMAVHAVALLGARSGTE